MKSFARRTSRRCAFLGQSRWALLVATVVSAAPALALDDRYQLTASGDISSDDNLTRTGGGIPRLSDVLTTARVAASATLPDGLRSYSLGANVSQVRYARFTQQDYTAFGFNAGLSEAIGRDVQVELVLSQSQSLLPLNNFQALVRDVVTTRNESLQLREAMDARWSVVEAVALAQTINSIGSLDKSRPASNPSSRTLRLPCHRCVALPFKVHPDSPARACFHNLSTCAASLVRNVAHNCAAAPNPVIRAGLSVPARKPCS